MEGVAFSQGECVDVFSEMGVKIGDMMVCGGGARSPLWRQMLSDIYGCKVSTLQSEQGGALGAAILAGVGAGLYPSLAEACKSLIKKGGSYYPDPENGAKYRKYMGLYSSLYHTLYDSFKKLAELTK